MSQQTPSQRRSGNPDGGSAWAQGLIVFAGVLLLMAGSFHAIAGLAAIIENEFYVTTPNYILEFDATAWGWIHLLLGVVLAFAGWGVFSGQTWARVVGITVALISAIANFAFIPYYPFWSLAIIALDVFVIWALATYGREMTL